MQSYKVFFKESSFLLTDHTVVHKNTPDIFIHTHAEELRSYVNRLLLQESPFQVQLCYPNIDRLFADFRSLFTVVEAAGGVVQTNNAFLLIERWGIPDLPKGHIESGEDPASCAIREVEEECGLHRLEITGKLPDTWHIYFRNETWFLKHTFWYTMECPAGQALIPQQEEDIEKVYWFPKSQVSEAAEKTYPSLREVLEAIPR